jgi:hypothetical protein
MLTIPTQDYRRSDYRVPPRSLTGLDALVGGRTVNLADVFQPLRSWLISAVAL